MAQPAKSKKVTPRSWLIKSEPSCYSIDDLERDGKAEWSGVRNYQARNYLRDEMSIGDWVLFYHSSAEPTGVVGMAKVASSARSDPTALDPAHPFFDPKSKPENPAWVVVDIQFVAKFPKVVSLAELKSHPILSTMMACQRGNRPSVQPVDPKHFQMIRKLGGLT